jgi:hypothetical protein
MKQHSFFLATLGAALMSLAFNSNSAETIQSDGVDIEIVTKNPERYDKAKIRIRGFAERDRHHLQIVQSAESNVSIVLQMPKRTQRSSSTRDFIEAVYARPMKETWRGVHGTFTGVFSWRPTKIPRYILVVEDVDNITKEEK